MPKCRVLRIELETEEPIEATKLVVELDLRGHRVMLLTSCDRHPGWQPTTDWGTCLLCSEEVYENKTPYPLTGGEQMDDGPGEGRRYPKWCNFCETYHTSLRCHLSEKHNSICNSLIDEVIGGTKRIDDLRARIRELESQLKRNDIDAQALSQSDR